MIPPTSPLTLRQYIGRVVITLALIGLALLLWQLRGILILVFGAVLVGVIFSLIARPLQKRLGLPHWAALLGAVLLVLPIAIAWFLPGGATAGITVTMAMLAKSIYVQHAVARIAKLRASGAGDGEIAAAGGVSVAGGVVGGVILALAVGSVIAALALGVPADELR